MSKVRQMLGRGAKRTTVTIDADTAAALRWLRGFDLAPQDRVSASRLLRDAARDALWAQGRRIHKGEVLTIEESGRRMDAEFKQRMEAD